MTTGFDAIATVLQMNEVWRKRNQVPDEFIIIACVILEEIWAWRNNCVFNPAKRNTDRSIANIWAGIAERARTRRSCASGLGMEARVYQWTKPP